MSQKNDMDTSFCSVFEEDFKANGEIRTDKSILFKGKFMGDIHSKAQITIAESGEIMGNIFCKDLVLNGKIKGNVEVEKKAILDNHAHIDGYLIASCLHMQMDSVIYEGFKIRSTK